MPSSVRNTTRHVHYNDIMTWARNPKGCDVWFRNPEDEDSRWEICTALRWSSLFEYRVIPIEYSEVWAAFLDGELEFLLRGNWEHWDSDSAPQFDSPRSHYRRRSSSREPLTTEREPLTIEQFIQNLVQLMDNPDVQSLVRQYRTGSEKTCSND